MSIKISATIDDDVQIAFKRYCKSKGYTVSSRITVLMKKDMFEASLK